MMIRTRLLFILHHFWIFTLQPLAQQLNPAAANASAQKTYSRSSPCRHRFAGPWNFLPVTHCRDAAAARTTNCLAATYLASQLRQIGIEPAGDNGGYIQKVSGEFNFYREGKKQWNTRNVIGILRGRDQKLKTK